MKKGHGDSSREKKKKMVICIEVSRTRTAMDVREAKAIVMTKTRESTEKRELKWGFRGGLQNENDAHHVTTKEDEATTKFGVKRFE